MRKNVWSEKGMTLIELLAVVVIMGIIAAIAVPAIGSIIQKSRTNAFIANAYTIRDASNYYLKEKLYPKEEIPEEISYKELVEKGFLEEIKDPDTGDKWKAASNETYVAIVDEKPQAICIKGIERKLCSRQVNGSLIEGAVPFDEMTAKQVTNFEQ